MQYMTGVQRIFLAEHNLSKDKYICIQTLGLWAWSSWVWVQISYHHLIIFQSFLPSAYAMVQAKGHPGAPPGKEQHCLPVTNSQGKGDVPAV